jgi:hypothetical protein
MGVAFRANYPASQSSLPNSQTVTMLLCREQLYLAPQSHNRTPFEDSGTCHPRHPVQHSSWACQPDPFCLATIWPQKAQKNAEYGFFCVLLRFLRFHHGLGAIEAGAGLRRSTIPFGCASEEWRACFLILVWKASDYEGTV